MKIEIALAGEIVPNGVYASVGLIGTCVFKWAHTLESIKEFDPEPHTKAHCTVLYSRNKKNVDGEASTRRVYTASIKEFTSWVGHDGKTYVVALLDSPQLQEAFKEWKKLGYTSDYPDYKPHITIKKGDIENVDEIIDLLTLSYFKHPYVLTFGAQKVEPLRD